MSHNWWIDGQRYTAPHGAETLIRVGASLFVLRAGATRPYALIVTSDKSNYGPGFSTGHFEFLDYLTERAGTLICTAQKATVQYKNELALPSSITVPAGDLRNAQRLDEIDKRHVPTLLFAVVGTNQLVYMCRWIHRRLASAVDRMYVIEQRNSRRPVIIEVANVYDDTLRIPTDSLTLHINGKPAVVPKPGKTHNGRWGDKTLRPLPLKDYIIVHDDTTGALVSIKPKG